MFYAIMDNKNVDLGHDVIVYPNDLGVYGFLLIFEGVNTRGFEPLTGARDGAYCRTLHVLLVALSEQREEIYVS